MKNLAHIYFINDIYVFGSRAKEIFSLVEGKNPLPEKSTSDVDIAVFIQKKTLSARRRAELSIAFEDIFDAAIDLIILNEADHNLALDVIKGELLYSANPVAQAEYELYILRRAADLAPFERERREMLLRG